MVMLPGMEPELECCLESLVRNSTLIGRVLIAVRTQEVIRKTVQRQRITIEYFDFWFDRGPTPAGNVQWRGRGYSHAVGLHHCLSRATTKYVLFTEPDVVYLKEGFDKLYIEAIETHDLAIVGVTRAADPRGLQFYNQQALGGFPTVISCLMKKDFLPPNAYLQGYLKMRPHAFPHANTEEETYERLDGHWLLQGCIPEFKNEFPNPEGAYPVGCNLYLYYINERYLSFHIPHDPKPDQLFNATTFNLNNFGLDSNYYGNEPLLFHSGHGGLNRLQQALGKKSMQIEYAKDLDHTLTTVLVRNWPHRSPYVFTEVVRDVIRDKRVCDIGCAEGDQLAMFSKYAREVFGVELNKTRAQPALDRGFDVIIGNYKDIGIPEADVYFSWIGAAEDAQFVEDLAATGRKATSLLFCRKGNHVKDIVERWNGRLVEFEYHEPHTDIPNFTKDGFGWAGIIPLNQ